MSADFYEILGVPQDADTAAIKKAYRQKARLTHPDVNPDPAALRHFQLLQEAYTVLIDPISRANYDQQRLRPYTPPPDEAPTPAPDYEANRPWNVSAKYDPAHRYGSTDYESYRKSSTVIGIITLIFAMTFLVDYLFSTEYSGQIVISVQNKGLITKRATDLEIFVVKTAEITFEKPLSAHPLKVGDVIDIKRSLIYGFLQFKPSQNASYERARTPAIITYLLAVVVYVAAFNAIMIKRHAERKFNAGLIATFFSVLLLLFVLLT